jgi:serine/threonine protein kinase
MPHGISSSRATDCNLLFGILALQLDFINRDALVAAMHAWLLDKNKSLGQILVGQGVLPEDRRVLLEALVQEHLKRHSDNPEKSLAAIGPAGSVREELKRLADPELDASLAHIPADTPREVDPYPTREPSVGAPTSSGMRFRILRPFARGGLGQVSIALDTELRREVALKEIRERQADDPESRARFVREAEITGALEHPGIVPVYGLGQYLDGRPFYAMRFIHGDSLKEALDRYHQSDASPVDESARATALRQLLRRFVDVCNAVAYAHSRGVLHRDLKPSNVMLGRFGETLVVDWGLAKHLGPLDATSESGEAPVPPASDSSTAVTQMGSALGTPQFMSPEQAAGRVDQLGPASDVYSLGATLYYILTGKPPFEGSDSEAVPQKVLSGDFSPPARVNPNAPAPLSAICLKAMALRPADRYPSPIALAEDIERWLAKSATSDATSITISGLLTSTANTTFRLEFFANSVSNPSGFGEGERFLGFATATTDPNGSVSFTATFATHVDPGQFISATATDPLNNTSQFAGDVVVVGAAARFQVMAPSTAVAGVPFDITVTAVDSNGNVATNYRGTVHFSISDPQGRFPPDYMFTAEDAGTHAFPGGVTLYTVGTQSITAMDTDSGITGSATVNVVTAANILVNDPNEDGNSVNKTQSETTLVLGSNNTVIVGYNDTFYANANPPQYIGYSVSNDGGNTFTDEGRLPINSNDSIDPVLARDNVTGRVYFATLSFNNSAFLNVYHSDDDGNTFAAPVNGAPGHSGAFFDKEWMTVDNYAGAGQGNVYLVVRDFGAGNGIYLTRSTDQGMTFNTNWVQIAAAGSGNVEGAWVTVGPDHAVYVCWFDNVTATESIKIRKSTDQGLTFGPAVTVAALRTTGVNGDLGLGGFRSNAFAQVVVNPASGNIYVTFDDKGTGSDRADVFFTQSADGGATWSLEVKVNDDTTTRDQWQPAIAVTPNGSKVGIFWYDRRNDSTNNLIDRYGVVGDIVGNTVAFEPNIRISDVSFPPVFGHDPAINPVYMGDYDQVVASASAFYLTWGDNRLADSAPDVRFARMSLGPAHPWVISSSADGHTTREASSLRIGAPVIAPDIRDLMSRQIDQSAVPGQAPDDEDSAHSALPGSKVISRTSTGNLNVPGSIGSVQLTFNQLTDPAMLGPAGVTLTGSAGTNIPANSVTPVAATNTTRFDIDREALGTIVIYNLAAEPHIGNSLSVEIDHEPGQAVEPRTLQAQARTGQVPQDSESRSALTAAISTPTRLLSTYHVPEPVFQGRDPLLDVLAASLSRQSQ